MHDDVALLDKYGLLFIIEDGCAKRPYVPSRRIHLDIELVADETGDDDYRKVSSTTSGVTSLTPCSSASG